MGLPWSAIDFSDAGNFHYWRREMRWPGADICLILDRSTLVEKTVDPVKRAIAADVPTYLIANDRGIARRMRPDGDHSGDGEPGSTGSQGK
jgi:hypothetical protein